MSASFDAVILADSPHAHDKVLGLTLAERGRRVALKAGARNVVVVEDEASRAALASWQAQRSESPLLIMRAGDQVVHVPLVEPLLAGTRERRFAIGDEGFAGALWVSAKGSGAVVDQLVAGKSDKDIAKSWRDSEALMHGELARHPATTAAERAAAMQMLMQLLVKPEDNPITRYVYRPISRPLTRALIGTPITPNQISIAVLVIGMIGCWLTARAGHLNLIAGAALVLLAGFIDGSDGEIARLRLTSSKLGAWLDTIVDEVTTTVYFIAAGYHTYLELHAGWVPWSIAVGLVGYAITIYGIYYFLIVVSKTGNSQHYVSDLEIVEGGLSPRPPKPSTAPPWVQTLGAMLKHVVRRDFINLGSLAIALINGYIVIYGVMLLGGMVSGVIVATDHIRLRAQLRELDRRGITPQLVKP